MVPVIANPSFITLEENIASRIKKVVVILEKGREATSHMGMMSTGTNLNAMPKVKATPEQSIGFLETHPKINKSIKSPSSRSNLVKNR